jgi:hypothetical protein
MNKTIWVNAEFDLSKMIRFKDECFSGKVWANQTQTNKIRKLLKKYVNSKCN